MNWKEFFKPTGKKFTLVAGLIGISFIIFILTIFAGMGLSGNGYNIFLFILNILVPFYSFLIFISSDAPNAIISPIFIPILTLIYVYILSCIFTHAMNNPEKRRKIVGVGIVVIVIMGILGNLSYLL